MSLLCTPSLMVELEALSYPIYIGEDLLDVAAYYEPHVKGQSVAIVSNQTVAPLYAERLVAMFQKMGKQVILITLPDGEEFKTWESLQLIFDGLLKARADRQTTLVALGGGVIGDMTGFAAASYMRGVPFIQVPTTLLSQVDSSVGGKTGINHPLGKNMIGAFYQPRAVVIDTSVLKTLPVRELKAGLAEVIKYGAIADEKFFAWIETELDKLLTCEASTIQMAIQRSCAIKAEVVGADERETGIRAILNFGHTFGHAIEAGLGYGEWLHGEAVGCGMVMAADLSCRLGLIDELMSQRIRRLVQAAGLPTVAPALGEQCYLDLMANDKKAQQGAIRFVLLSSLGNAHLGTAPHSVVVEVLKQAIQIPPPLA